jgi:hypothetical protein
LIGLRFQSVLAGSLGSNDERPLKMNSHR